MLVVGEKIPLVGLILNRNFKDVTFYTEKVAFFYTMI